MSGPERDGAFQRGMHPRIARELKTVKAMIKIYCRANHRGSKTLCAECETLSEYAEKRLACCPFQENKTTCGNCPVHCYKPDMRKRIVEVMRFSGPKMIFHHPLLACAHWLDEKRGGKQIAENSVMDKRKSRDS